jgi:phage shock protein C
MINNNDNTNKKEIKRLYKSDTDKILCGVCGGIAEYLNIDSTIVRLIWVLISLHGGMGILLYIISCFIIPEKPNDEDSEDEKNSSIKN